MSVFPAGPLASLGDEKLVRLAREENEDAFVLLVTRCMPMLQRLSKKYSSAQLESEDLLQEGLMALLSAVRIFREGEGVPFRSYAYACARNRMISALRQVGGDSREELSLDSEEHRMPVSDSDDPARLLLQREELADLCLRLRTVLTPVEYRVLMLYLGSYSYREIARKLNIETKAVDNALQRMRRKLANAAVL